MYIQTTQCLTRTQIIFSICLHTIDTRVLTSSNLSATCKVSLKKKSVASTPTCVSSTRTGSIKTLPKNTTKSFWSIPPTPRSVTTLASTGFAIPSINTEKCGGSRPRDARDGDCAKRVTGPMVSREARTDRPGSKAIACVSSVIVRGANGLVVGAWVTGWLVGWLVGGGQKRDTAFLYLNSRRHLL
jgi:hypothetical protein